MNQTLKKHAPSRNEDISLPSTSASTLYDVDKSGNGGEYRTPKVDTLECAQLAGVGEFPFKEADWLKSLNTFWALSP
jgi:hypothetical protein